MPLASFSGGPVVVATFMAVVEVVAAALTEAQGATTQVAATDQAPAVTDGEQS